MESSCAVTQQATGGNRRSAALHAFAGGWYACFFVVGRGRIGCVGMPNTRKVEASQDETPTQNETCLLQKHHRQQLPLLNRTTTRVLQYYIATASSYTVILLYTITTAMGLGAPSALATLQVGTVSRPTQLRRMSLPMQIAGVDFRLKIHIRLCRAYA